MYNWNYLPYAGPSQPRNEQAAPTQQASPPPQPPSPLVQFTSYLKAVYDRQKFPNYGKWPPCSSIQFINLACIEKDKISKKKSDEFTKASIHGNIDDIVKEKHPIKYQQIAKLDDGSWPKLILVEGAPGVGKSTFAWKLCRKWSKGKIWSQYKLVVLLRLRDKRVREAKTLYDLIYYDDPNERKLIVKEIVELQGKETLLLFEGYDELPAQLQRDEESVVLEIISGSCLPKSTILVTSRHSASGFLHERYKKRISQHIEILGFTKENIQTYINENVEDSEERQGLERYLSCYPHIRTMMYVPLNSVIVVEVYHQCHDKNKPAPKTMTELYTSLVHTLLIRYLMDKGKQEIMIESFDDLKTYYYDIFNLFCSVCKTAYDGISNDQQIIFYKSKLPNGFKTLDLMQEVHELYVDKGDCVSYNFLHLTIQEYLAAVHLSMQPMDVQIQHFKEKKTKSSFVMVLRFLSGLTKLHNYPQQDLALILESQDRYGWSRLNFHWLFEAQNVEYISSVLKKKVLSVDDLSTPFDAYALGYCVAHSNLRWNLSHFTKDSTINDMLVIGLQAEETQCKGTFYKVDIEIDKDTVQFLKPTVISKFFRRTNCTITAISFFSGVTTELMKDLTICFHTLTWIVEDSEIKLEHCCCLGELIRSSTLLTHFTMDSHAVRSEELELTVDMYSCLEPIATALGQNTSLESVSFPNNGLLLLGIIIALMRTGRSELYPRALQLLNIRFDDKEGALLLGKRYKNYPNTTAKYLSPIKICSLYIYDIPFRHFGDTSLLSDLCNLRKLVIKYSDFPIHDIVRITEGFLVNCKAADNGDKTCTLKHIELSGCHIGHAGVQHLEKVMRENTSLVTGCVHTNYSAAKDTLILEYCDGETAV